MRSTTFNPVDVKVVTDDAVGVFDVGDVDTVEYFVIFPVLSTLILVTLFWISTLDSTNFVTESFVGVEVCVVIEIVLVAERDSAGISVEIMSSSVASDDVEINVSLSFGSSWLPSVVLCNDWGKVVDNVPVVFVTFAPVSITFVAGFIVKL